MRGTDHEQSGMFGYISAERRVPKDHPLRPIRVMVDAALKELGPRFNAIYARSWRPSIPPEKLLRASLLQVPYTVRKTVPGVQIRLQKRSRWRRSARLMQ